MKKETQIIEEPKWPDVYKIAGKDVVYEYPIEEFPVVDPARAILTFKKDKTLRLSDHFLLSEFECRCSSPECEVFPLSLDLIEWLEILRTQWNHGSMIVNCGYRCPEHNRKVGGASRSQHLLGLAADIRVKKNGKVVSPSTVADAAETLTFPGVGRYDTFTHVDMRSGPLARWEG